MFCIVDDVIIVWFSCDLDLIVSVMIVADGIAFSLCRF